MKKIDYALENTNFDKKDIIYSFCPNDFNLKDRGNSKEVYFINDYSCGECWNEEIGEESQ